MVLDSAPPGGYGVNRPVDWRRVVPLTVALVLVLALLVLGLAWPGIDRARNQFTAGTLRETGFALPTDHRAALQLPWGSLELGTTDPRTTLPDDVAQHDVGGDVRPPDGGRFVGVTWSVGEGGVVAPHSLTASPATGAPTVVSLLTGGHRYRLAPHLNPYCPALIACIGADSINRAWLAVDGEADDVRLAATYDGVTQIVDMRTGYVDAGRAAGLRTTDTTTPGCGQARWAGGLRGRNVHCTITLTRGPYLAGMGWAPRGRLWYAAVVQLDRPDEVTRSTGGRRSTFEPSPFTIMTSFMLSHGHRAFDRIGNARDGALGPPPSSGRTAATVAFSVPIEQHDEPLVVHASWALDPASSRSAVSGAPTRATATWTVTP